MQVQIGTTTKSGSTPVILDTAIAINGHIQISGVSGMGKTHRIRALVEQFVKSAHTLKQPLRIHVFDPHGDMDLPWSSEVKFSEATEFGYNPLEINPDPDYGGVRRAIQKFIAGVQKHKALGTKQEAVMRYLLEDLYESRGFRADDPRSWLPDDPREIRLKLNGKESRLYLDVEFSQIERFKSLIRDSKTGRTFGGFDSDFKCWWIEKNDYEGELLMWEPRILFKTAPSIDDAVRFAERKLKAHFCGTNSAAMALLQDVNLAASAYHRKVNQYAKRGAILEAEEAAKLENDLSKAKDKSLAAYESYLEAIRYGRELDDLIRYNSTEVLTSVYERLQNLRAIGIFRAVTPPFDPAKPVWRYAIKPLDIPVQRMFVDLVCSRIFERAMQRGVQKDLIEIIICDEGARYATDEPGNILNIIANEARKFGLGLWVASQSPSHFTDDFIKATGTMIILGLSSADANLAARKLGIDADMLSKISPQKTALVQIKNKGTLQTDFQMLNLHT